MLKKIIFPLVLLAILGTVASVGLYFYQNQKPAPTPPPNPVYSTAGLKSDQPTLYHIAFASKIGQYLTDSKGMTLYTYAKDRPGELSTCVGDCAVKWPPFLVSQNDLEKLKGGTLSNIKRPDSDQFQYAWTGLPLYFYQADLKPGDVNGEGVGNLWRAAR